MQTDPRPTRPSWRDPGRRHEASARAFRAAITPFRSSGVPTSRIPSLRAGIPSCRTVAAVHCFAPVANTKPSRRRFNPIPRLADAAGHLVANTKPSRGHFELVADFALGLGDVSRIPSLRAGISRRDAILSVRQSHLSSRIPSLRAGISSGRRVPRRVTLRSVANTKPSRGHFEAAGKVDRAAEVTSRIPSLRAGISRWSFSSVHSVSSSSRIPSLRAGISS